MNRPNTQPRQSIPFYGFCPQCQRPLDGENLRMDGINPTCRHCWENSGEDHTIRNPLHVAAEQAAAAKEDLDRDLEDYAHLPFRDVDKLVAPIPPGDVGFVCAFSGQGKTTFVSSAIQRLIAKGQCVYVVPLESEPKIFRTHLACKTLKLHSGMLLTGLYKARLPAEQWHSMRRDVQAEIEAQTRPPIADVLFVSPTRRMDVYALERNAKHAAQVGADFFIIDHIDHIAGGDGRNLYGESSRVIDRVLDLTQEYGLKTLCTSQLNNEGIKQDPLGQYRCPRPHHVYMGGKKRQNAAWMIGLFRPLRLDGVSRDDMAKARAGGEPWKVLEPNCMAVSLMKSRHFGEREGHRTYLHVRDGIVDDMDEMSVQAIMHGIR